MKQPPLTIGITTFNRRALLETVARSLGQVRRLDQAHVLVLDDCSQEFDIDFLARLFPQAQVLRAPCNSGGADFAMHALFRHFVQHGSGYLLNLDSDLLASRSLVERCLQIIRDDRATQHPCLYSVFNAASHRVRGVDGAFLVKPTVGAAGTLWRHDLLAEVLAHVPVSRSFDWDWSAYLTRRGVPIRVTPQSYLQHLGRVGQHSCSLVGMDHGERFDDYGGENLAAFLDQTREGLLQMLGEQQRRIDQQNQAMIQLTEVIQNQARLVSEIIRCISPDQPVAVPSNRAAPCLAPVEAGAP